MEDTGGSTDAVRGSPRKTKRGKRRHRGIFERPKKSGVWWVRYRVKGRLYREKVGPKALALEVYHKRKAEIAEGRFFPERRKPAEVWDPLFAGITRTGEGGVTLTGYVADYLARKGSTLRDLDGARRYARYFAEAPETKGKSMRALTTQAFELYRERRRQGGALGAARQRGAASVSTLNKELSFPRAVFYDFNEALEDRNLPPIANPVRTRLFVTEEAGRTRYLSDDEEVRLREALPAADWPKVLVAVHAGLDRGAQFGLRWSNDVDLRTRTLHAERRKGRRSGPVSVTVPINDDLLAVLRALPSRGRSEWVFPNATGTGPLDGREFDRLVFRPALKRAGIRDFRWKDLRHTFATRLRMKGIDTGTIRDLLGHTTDRMTKRYAHAAPSYLLAAVQRLARTTELPNEVAPGVAPSAAQSNGARVAARVSSRVGG